MRLRRGNLITQNMALSWTIADRRNHRQLFEIRGDPKRRKHPGNMRGIAQADKLWKLRVKRPKLEFDPLVKDISPKLALDRHQTSLIRFFLQLAPTIGVVRA